MARKKIAVKRFHFDDPIYLGRILVCIGGEYEDCEKRWGKLFGYKGKTVSSIRGRAYLPDSKDCGLWFPECPGACFLVHEALHATSHVMRKSGIEFSEATEEAYAYHIGWVVDEIVKRAW